MVKWRENCQQKRRDLIWQSDEFLQKRFRTFKIWYVRNLNQSYFSLTSYDFSSSPLSFFFLRGENISFLYRKNWKNESKIWKLETIHRIPINHQSNKMEDFFDLNDMRNIHPEYIYISTNKLFDDLLFKKKKKIATINQCFPIYLSSTLCIIFTFSVFAQFARFSTNISFLA